MLQIAPRVCWPPDTGAKLRNFHLARTLSEHARVSLLAFADRRPAIPELEKVYEQVITVGKPPQYSFSKLVLGAVGGMPLPILNYTSNEMHESVARLLTENEIDIVLIESIHLMSCLPAIRAARKTVKIVCDWHNIESELMQRYAERERNHLRRMYARRTARLMREYEHRAMREFDAHAVVSVRDAARLREINSSAHVAVIENGVDTANYVQPDDAAREKHRILFVGSMDYHANVEGVVNFAHEVWPRVHERHADLVFTIVGRDPTPEVRALAEIAGVEVTGTVDDVRPFYRNALISIVPLKVGGGSRLKILESMAAGVPVLSTTLGAEGLSVKDDEHLLIADSSETIADAVTALVDNPNRRRRLADNARALVREFYDWQRLGAKLFEFLQRQTSVAAA